MSERGQYGNELVVGRSRGGHGGYGHPHPHGGGRAVARYHGEWGWPLNWGWEGWDSPYYGWSYYGSACPYVSPCPERLPDYLVDVRRVNYLMGKEIDAPVQPQVHHERVPYVRTRHGRGHHSRGHHAPVQHAPMARAAMPPSHGWGGHLAAPAAHLRHHDYVFVANYGWLPRWYPYWEAYWYWYWQYLYYYYGGDAQAEYAEYARDVALRSLAPQWGWR